jgi:hypothetical protein
MGILRTTSIAILAGLFIEGICSAQENFGPLDRDLSWMSAIRKLSRNGVLGSCPCNFWQARDMMRRKLLPRTRRQKGELSTQDPENIQRRAGSAYSELQEA